MKNIVAIVGLPKSSKIVIEVELLYVVGSLGLNTYPLANCALSVITSLVADTLTPKSICVVAFGVPDVTGSCKGTALVKSFAVTDPSAFTGNVSRN